MDKMFLSNDDLIKMNGDLRIQLGKATDALDKVKWWIEKATKEDMGQDWDDVFQAREVLREFAVCLDE